MTKGATGTLSRYFATSRLYLQTVDGEEYHYGLIVALIDEINLGLKIVRVSKETYTDEKLFRYPFTQAEPNEHIHFHGYQLRQLIADAEELPDPIDSPRVIGDPVMYKQAKVLFEFWMDGLRKDYTNNTESRLYDNEYYLDIVTIYMLRTQDALKELYDSMLKNIGYGLAFLDYMPRSTIH